MIVCVPVSGTVPPFSRARVAPATCQLSVAVVPTSIVLAEVVKLSRGVTMILIDRVAGCPVELVTVSV